MNFTKIILITIPIFILIYFIIGQVFYHFALNAHSSASRDIGEKNYVSSSAIDDEREQQERDKDRTFIDTVKPEQLTITSHDGLKLQGYIFEQDASNERWIFALHGYTGSVRQMTRWNRQLYELGYNIFAPDLRGHGTSEGDYYGMGWLDQQDIADWLAVLLQRHPQADVTLYGVSMGASAALNFAPNAPAAVTGVIADSAFTSVASIFETQLQNVLHLPAFPILHAANTVAKWRIGLDFYEASTIERVRDINVPILYIHGGADTFIPVKNVYELAAATSAPHDVWVVEEANHGEAVKVAPDLYRDKLVQFIEGQ